MTAYPLEAPLSALSPARRVYIQRQGLVYLYPASIVRDIANDRYTMDDDTPWRATQADWEVGRALYDQLGGGLDLVDHNRLFILLRTIWVSAGGQDVPFTAWFDSLSPDAHPEWLGAAARVAARELMTFPVFQHRHLIDDPITLA